MERKQPNILFVFSDQQRWDTVGCYGAPLGKELALTPHLDALAAKGTRFEHAFTCQPVCGPARACIQTGLYATQTGCWRNDIALPLDAVTLPRLLRPAGYETAYIGKWHLASTGQEADFKTKPVPPERRGGYDDYWLASDVLEFTSHGYGGHMFDGGMRKVSFPEGRYRVDALTGYAIDYLRNRDRSKPFFLFLSYIEPHHQNDRNHFEGPSGSKARFKDYPIPGDLQGTQSDWRVEMPDYLGCCSALDGAVGMLRQELANLGLEQDTVVIYTSDHGCHFRTRNEEYKRSCHDGSVRIPMIAAGPGFDGGGVVKGLASLIDVPPTVLNAAGVSCPPAMQGRPLQELKTGVGSPWREEVFIQISESQIGRALRTSRWKYSVRAPGPWTLEAGNASDLYIEDFLYDLEADPHERNNLVADPAKKDVRAALRSKLLRHMEAAGETPPKILPAAP